jgi:hypothetical protein
MPDGSIWTGFYSDWDQLSKEDRQTVIDTRAENKCKGGRKLQASGDTTQNNHLKNIKAQMNELKRSFALLLADPPPTDRPYPALVGYVLQPGLLPYHFGSRVVR